MTLQEERYRLIPDIFYNTLFLCKKAYNSRLKSRDLDRQSQMSSELHEVGHNFLCVPKLRKSAAG